MATKAYFSDEMLHPDLHIIVLNSSKMKLGTWASATLRIQRKKENNKHTIPQYT